MYIATCEKWYIGEQKSPFLCWMITGNSKKDLAIEAIKRAKKNFNCYKMGTFAKGEYLPYPDCPDTTERYSTVLVNKSKKDDLLSVDGYPVFVLVITIMWIEKIK